MYGNTSLYLFAINTIHKKRTNKEKRHFDFHIKLNENKLTHLVNHCKPIVNHITIYTSNI